MAQKTATFVDEMTSAARGCWALLTGNRQAASYFDFSQRGLVSSFIAVIAGIVIAAYGPMLLGFAQSPGTATQVVLGNIGAFAIQALVAYLVLRQISRLDGFIPYLVASNWVTLLTAIALFIAPLLGGLGVLLLVAILVSMLVIFVNIGRLIVTLTPMQIATLCVAQIAAVLIGLLILSMIIVAGSPLPA
ncbi:hypothetical protein VW29_19005 [Devosia limi DSM 17137]|uniref:Yip1 domain-containing protein n=1 Tax=Devosia limi DSM 17137 TaxID=1121477 RepID=A0A0F5L610_9HYPH|nr:hypothetical protein [Devosia limi]KKB77047.1 hypothetical protein VW29_19005 [Devosia limi DSM 17137]SHF42133.1 hypothetical protein SAMN02745223_02611 [Devosia limi DSM 17137]